MNRARIAFALIRRFFVYALARPVNWIVFVVLPAGAVVGMRMLLDMPGMGLLLFTTTLHACIIASLNLRERESGIYHRVLAAPVSPTLYSVALWCAVFAVVAIELVIVLTLVAAIVPESLDVGFGHLLVVMMVYAATAGAFGILLTALARTYTGATVLANVTVIFTSMISGCFWPLDLMPDYMQTVAKALPQTWVNLALAELRSGADIGDVGVHLLVVALFGTVFLLAFGLLRARAR